MQRPFVHKTDSGWDSVTREGYAEDRSTQVVRNTIVGHRKDSQHEDGPSLELRYFEIPPGATTRLERHEHEHIVIGGEGEGHAIVGTEVRAVRPHDVVYVAALQPHQFVNRAETTFGFYCVVPADRDRGVPPTEEQLEALLDSPAATYVDRTNMPPTSRGPTA